METAQSTESAVTFSSIFLYQCGLCGADHNQLHVVACFPSFSGCSIIEKLGCGDFSFPTRLSRRYFGGYCSGVTAISFLYLCDLCASQVNSAPSIKRASRLFCSRLLTVCPLVMVQQAGYDHLRILCDPFVSPSLSLFFMTGFVTGIWAQFLVQPFLSLLAPSSGSMNANRYTLSSLYKSFPKNAFQVRIIGV